MSQEKLGVDYLRCMMVVLYFDGECHLCHGAVQFVLRHERAAQLLFSPLQGARAEQVLPEEVRAVDSLVLEENGSFYSKSGAALRLLPYLKWYWQWLNVFWLMPGSLRDAVYDYIARHRYAWWGKMDACKMPDRAERARLLP